VSRDLNEAFLAKTRKFIPKMRGRLKDYDTLVTKNIIFVKRTKDIGFISAEEARDYALTGPCIRGSGVFFDIRKSEPYSLYPEFSFDIPVLKNGDSFDRYMVRMLEMEQCLRIIEQALDRLPEGPVRAKGVPQWLEPPAGETHFSYESPRGHLGIYIVSDGTRIPYRMKWRVPSLSNLSILPQVLKGTLLADTIAILGSMDVVIPEIDR
jgi:NADH-quinone oxidoreductase subunit D